MTRTLSNTTKLVTIHLPLWYYTKLLNPLISPSPLLDTTHVSILSTHPFCFVLSFFNLIFLQTSEKCPYPTSNIIPLIIHHHPMPYSHNLLILVRICINHIRTSDITYQGLHEEAAAITFWVGSVVLSSIGLDEQEEVVKPEFWVIFCGADSESCFRALGGFIGVGIAFFGYSAFIYVYVYVWSG